MKNGFAFFEHSAKLSSPESQSDSRGISSIDNNIIHPPFIPPHRGDRGGYSDGGNSDNPSSLRGEVAGGLAKTKKPTPSPSLREGSFRAGFTLVELSIVLVIIGLLIGGILVAQSMIESSKVQKFIGEVNQYLVVTNNFKNKYSQLPGDSNRFTNPGDNDGKIEYGTGGGAVGEWTRAWAHLSESGELQETYTGGTTDLEGSVPESKAYKDVLFTYYYRINASGFNPTGQCMFIGKHGASTHNIIGGIPVVSSLAIDVKIDDGSADTGDLRTLSSGSYQTGCLTNTTGPFSAMTAGEYNVSNTDAFCTLYYWIEDELY